MADTAAAQATSGFSPIAIAATLPERTTYGVGGGRKTLIAFTFLLLLPFFASLPAMIFMRMSRGLWVDAVGLSLMATGFSVIMFLLLINLMFSLRAHLHLGETGVHMTLPSGRGPTPMLRYRSETIPYADIAAVETRREIYGGSLTPVMLHGARLIKKDGTFVRLGYDSEANTNQVFPWMAIAEQIAKRAGLTVHDAGSVRRSVGAKMLGIVSHAPPTPITADEIAALNRAHFRVMVGIVSMLLCLVAIGIFNDISNPPSSLASVVDRDREPVKPKANSKPAPR
jgi:hypothetical protein